MKNRNHGLSEKELVQLLMAVWEPWSVIPLIWKMPTPLLFHSFLKYLCRDESYTFLIVTEHN